MKEFFNETVMQNHPLRVLKEFLDQEKASELAKQYTSLRFVGYVLDISYDKVVIITSDPFKISVGGVPRNSLLIMTPAKQETVEILHFTLLRVLDSAPTPLTKDIQQTFFELQKKAMPELDVFTQSELQWGALKTEVLGMFYPHPENADTIEFSGDMNNFVSAHKYKVYSPNNELLNLVINSLVQKKDSFELGKLRLTECRLPLPNRFQPNVDVLVSPRDFMATRTAMFGKTRLGKSNVVKLIAQSLIETTKTLNNVGQLIFDINGEYANDNPQDGKFSLRSSFENRCEVYSLSAKTNTSSKSLKLDFYKHPDRSQMILSNLLTSEGRATVYVQAFKGVSLPSIEEINGLAQKDKLRAQRKVLIYWAILHRAGFKADETKLKTLMTMDPHFSQKTKAVIYEGLQPQQIDTLDSLSKAFELAIDANRQTSLESSTVGNNLFDSDDIALLNFLKPVTGAGPMMLKRFHIYHDPDADDFNKEIIKAMNEGKTVILDFGNADEEVMRYFSEELASSVLFHQVEKFTNNELGDHYMQLYFEEAHNLFPAKEDSKIDIYRRLAKEGAKYHIGMVYSTQSVTTINRDLLAQTENFFVAHMSSEDEVNMLAKMNVAFENIKVDILRAKTPGYVRMLTKSHRFVVPVQAKKFEPKQQP